MAADLVSFDCWPGGGPEGEDDGFNAVITRTQKGQDLYERALAAGVLVSGKSLNSEDFASFQPHQLRKRYSVWARLAGQRAAGMVTPQTKGLGVTALARTKNWKQNLAQARGTRQRLKSGKGTEPLPIKG